MTRSNHEQNTRVRLRFTAAAVADATGRWHAPGAVLVEMDTAPSDPIAPRPAFAANLRVLAVGGPADISTGDADHTIDRPGDVLIPPLVNAHTHLDLTSLGPLPFDGDFTVWLSAVRTGRPTDAAALTASVTRGVDLSLAGGVAAVGDIAGNGPAGPRPAFDALADAPLAGVSFLEFFTMGPAAHAGLDALAAVVSELRTRAHGGIRLGLQPHAPFSVNLAGYAFARTLAADFVPPLPIATHLAESPEERELVAQGTGPRRAFLESIGVWSDEQAAEFGRGFHPVEHLLGSHAPRALPSGSLAIHLNDCPPEVIPLLAAAGVSVVICPRASAYFGFTAQYGPHPVAALRAAGVPVCLGTDSIINLDTPDRITTLDDARLLVQRDNLDPFDALHLATTAGAAALGLDPHAFTLEPGPLAGLVAVPLNQSEAAPSVWSIFTSNIAPAFLLMRTNCDPTGSGTPAAGTPVSPVDPDPEQEQARPA